MSNTIFFFFKRILLFGNNCRQKEPPTPSPREHFSSGFKIRAEQKPGPSAACSSPALLTDSLFPP